MVRRIPLATSNRQAVGRNLWLWPSLGVASVFWLSIAIGCATARQAPLGDQSPGSSPPIIAAETQKSGDRLVSLTAHWQEDAASEPQTVQFHEVQAENAEFAPISAETRSESLIELESLAQASNPALRRLRQEAAAATARANYVGRLPDPTVGVNVFAQPIETAAGSQRANMSVMQMLPWLHRLDAQAQQACFEAMALQQLYEAERLKVVGDLRAAWHQLYVIGQQIATTRANQEVLGSLIETVNATVAVGRAAPGDVRLATVEYSRLEEQLLTLRQRSASVQGQINRLVGRDSDVPVGIPQQIDAAFPHWSHSWLRQLAWQNQPAVVVAQIRTQATRWGVEIARLKRRPDLSLSASWFAIDDNRPPSSIVDVGEDAWSIGAQVTIPLWREKYDSMEREANWRHAASHASVEEAMQQFDAVLWDLWEKAKAAHQTVQLYRDTILPDARQTLDVDIQSYSDGTVGFDRVVRDFRTVLAMELGYHQALGELATALARIRQATGVELTSQATGADTATSDEVRPAPGEP